MRLTGKLSEIYIPTFMGNRELPESEQIQVKINHPTQATRDLLSSDLTYRQSEAGTEIKVKTKHRELIETCVGTIKNLETDMDGRIENGLLLMQSRDPRLSMLIDELVVQIKSKNEITEQAEKN